MNNAILHAEELTFLTSQNLTVDDVFDGRGLTKQEYAKRAKDQGKIIVLGKECTVGAGHRLKTRSGGHCIQCHPSKIAYASRHSKANYLYIYGSLNARLIKVGMTNSTEERTKSLNVKSYAYANADDWELLYRVWIKQAGEVETKLRQRLEQYAKIIEYQKGDKTQLAKEAVRCPFSTVKAALDDILGIRVREKEYLLEHGLDGYEF